MATPKKKEKVPEAPVREDVAPKEVEVASEIKEPKVIPTIRLSHHLLYYGDGEVMISDFSYLPASVLSEIEKFTKVKPTIKFKKFDLTKYLPEMLKAFGLENYKGIDFDRDIKFKFSKATLYHSLDKGDCFNYPDTYISLVADAFKLTKNKQGQLGYPESNFTIFPENTKKINDKAKIKSMNQLLSHVYNPKDPTMDHPLYYQVGENIYALLSGIGMGMFSDIFQCNKKECLKADYYLKYPACGS